MVPMAERRDFQLRGGEPRVAVLVDNSMFVLASDEYPITWTPSRRTKALIVALLETALAEAKEMETDD